MENLLIVLNALIPNEEVNWHVNANVFIITLCVAPIFEKLAVSINNCAFKTVKNVVMVQLPGAIVYVWVFPA